MKFAPVVPPGAEDQLPSNLTAHFAFANVLAYRPGYAEFFLGKPGLIVDCPIYEDEVILGPRELRNVCDFMQPDFLIIPDVRHDYHATITKLNSYLEFLDSPACTGVLQGESITEVWSCGIAMWQAGLRRFAIPKDLVKSLGVTRRYLTQFFLDEGLWNSETRVHWLGGLWPYDECQGAPDIVMSMDTAEPYNAALKQRLLKEGEPPPRPKDWWASGGVLSRNLLGQNIEWVRSQIDDVRTRD